MQSRSEYIQEVRNSFASPANTTVPSRVRPESYQEEEVSNKIHGFWKIRLFFSIMLFVTFVICDKMGVELFGFDMKQILEELQTITKI